jgi:hypothetical protein
VTEENLATADRGPVLFTLINQFTDVFGGLARHLRDSRGVTSVLVHMGPLPDRATSDLSPANFVEIVDGQAVLLPPPRDEIPPVAELVARAEGAERKYGIRIVEMIRADRHLGPDFANGADTPTSLYAKQFNYPQSVVLCLKLLEFFECLVDRLRPCAIVTAPADAARMALTAVAEARGIPIRIPGPNYSNDAFQWRVNRYFWPGGLVAAYDSEAAVSALAVRHDRRDIKVLDSDRTEYARRAIRSGKSIAAPLRSILRALRRQAGDIVKRRKRVYGGYRLGETVVTTLRTWWERRRQMNEAPLQGRLPDGQPYVFFPLVVEPETTLQCESPMSDNQLTLIDWLAKTLPAGWRLVIKEHPGFTYPRPYFFWQQIRRYPNVNVAAIYESGEALAENARIVAVINGSLGIQAAAGGVPVLTFNPYWWGRFLPQVVYAGNYEETAAALRYLADDSNLPALAERQRLGEALVRALDVGSIKLKDKRILEEKALGEPLPIEDVEAIAAALLQSLERTKGDTHIPSFGRGQPASARFQTANEA